MALPAHATPVEKIWHYAYLTICALIFVFLIVPIIIIVPLSFNTEPYFTFTEGMLAFDPEAYSTRWYQDIFKNGMQNPEAPLSWAWFSDAWNNAQWLRATRNSFFIATIATIVATTLLSLIHI